MSSLDLAVIGNCSVSALIDERARIVWSCFPRFDGDPVFCALMNDHQDGDKGQQGESAAGQPKHAPAMAGRAES